MTRTFTDEIAVRQRTPLLIGITGVSSSGKTFSALRLAEGIRRVVGGECFVVDTEAKRALHYAERFKFRHVDFAPPHGPQDYLAAIEHCVSKGAKVLVIDSMSHEHSGVGGVMDQVEATITAQLKRIFGDKYEETEEWKLEKERKKRFMLAMVKPKGDRKRLNARIVQLGINAIFCYRALDKIKPVTGGEPEKLGWQPETTSPLVYEMTCRFLLPPGSDGRPNVEPENEAERLAVKNPIQFRDWFKPGLQLSEDVGQRLAEWAAGTTATPPAPHEPDKHSALLSAIALAPDPASIEALLSAARKEPWSSEQKAAIKAAKESRTEELSRQTPGQSDSSKREPGQEG